MLRDKFAMAAMSAVRTVNGNRTDQQIAKEAYQIADAMMKERANWDFSGDPDALGKPTGVPIKWQPDWSQAPEWVTHFFCEQDENDENKLNSFWCEEAYRLECFDSGYRGYGRVISAPDFGYQGPLQDSLRKRPKRSPPRKP